MPNSKPESKKKNVGNKYFSNSPYLFTWWSDENEIKKKVSKDFVGHLGALLDAFHDCGREISLDEVDAHYEKLKSFNNETIKQVTNIEISVQGDDPAAKIMLAYKKQLKRQFSKQVSLFDQCIDQVLEQLDIEIKKIKHANELDEEFRNKLIAIVQTILTQISEAAPELAYFYEAFNELILKLHEPNQNWSAEYLKEYKEHFINDAREELLKKEQQLLKKKQQLLEAMFVEISGAQEQLLRDQFKQNTDPEEHQEIFRSWQQKFSEQFNEKIDAHLQKEKQQEREKINNSFDKQQKPNIEILKQIIADGVNATEGKTKQKPNIGILKKIIDGGANTTSAKLLRSLSPDGYRSGYKVIGNVIINDTNVKKVPELNIYLESKANKFIFSNQYGKFGTYSVFVAQIMLYAAETRQKGFVISSSVDPYVVGFLSGMGFTILGYDLAGNKKKTKDFEKGYSFAEQHLKYAARKESGTENNLPEDNSSTDLRKNKAEKEKSKHQPNTTLPLSTKKDEKEDDKSVSSLTPISPKSK